MNRKHSLQHRLTLAVSISLGFIGSLGVWTSAQAHIQNRGIDQQMSHSWQAKRPFDPPSRGAPATTTGGASRSNCVEGAVPLTAVMPANRMAVTASASPTLFFYVPETVASEAELVVKDENENDIGRMTVKLPNEPGIVAIALSESETFPQLEVGQQYQWYFAMICNPSDRLANVFIDGWIERRDPSPSLMNDLKTAEPQAAIELYLNADLWQDAVATLGELRRVNPNDATLAAQWQELLSAAGVAQNIAEAPLIFDSAVSVIRPE